MSFLLYNSRHRYSPTNDDQEDIEESLLKAGDPDVVIIRYRTATCALLLAALIGSLGLWVGQYTFQFLRAPSKHWSTAETIGFQSDEYNVRTFGYNQTFASTPSNETNMAWDSLFPSKRFARWLGRLLRMLKMLQKEGVLSRIRLVI